MAGPLSRGGGGKGLSGGTTKKRFFCGFPLEAFVILNGNHEFMTVSPRVMTFNTEPGGVRVYKKMNVFTCREIGQDITVMLSGVVLTWYSRMKMTC